MKIGIVTQPLGDNYGGLLQNWALQQVLIKMGHRAVTLDQSADPMVGAVHWALFRLKCRVLGWFGRGPQRVMDAEAQHTHAMRHFADTHIHRTSKVMRPGDFAPKARALNADAFIVGSDQVWRPRYTMHLDANFLSFTSLPKIAYAASFGNDGNEYTAETRVRCDRLLADFKAVSVREDGGVELCHRLFGRDDAVHVLDPTLLVPPEDYLTLSKEASSHKKPYLLTYILDSSEDKRQYVAKTMKQLDMRELALAHDVAGCEPSPMISPTEWVRAFAEADAVVCDSFHGACFSIIFRKPFVVLANAARGNERLASLLRDMGLEDHLVTDTVNVNIPPTDWQRVHRRLSTRRAQSLQFLYDALSL